MQYQKVRRVLPLKTRRGIASCFCNVCFRYQKARYLLRNIFVVVNHTNWLTEISRVVHTTMVALFCYFVWAETHSKETARLRRIVTIKPLHKLFYSFLKISLSLKSQKCFGFSSISVRFIYIAWLHPQHILSSFNTQVFFQS